jgi:hypothetical protein
MFSLFRLILAPDSACLNFPKYLSLLGRDSLVCSHGQGRIDSEHCNNPVFLRSVALGSYERPLARLLEQA